MFKEWSVTKKFLFIWNMLLYPKLALITISLCDSITIDNVNNGKNQFFCHFSVIAFFNEKAMGAVVEAVIDAIIAPWNPPSGFCISNVTVSVAPSISKPNFCSNSAHLLLWCSSSFEINKVNPFSALTASYPLIFLSNLSNTDEFALDANLGKTPLAKGRASYNNVFLHKLFILVSNILPRHPINWIILDNWGLLIFISVEMLLAKLFLILVFCLVVRNNLCGNYSSWKFFFVILNFVPVFFVFLHILLFWLCICWFLSWFPAICHLLYYAFLKQF